MWNHRSPRFTLSLFIVIVGVALAGGVSQANTLHAESPAHDRASQLLTLATSAMVKANQTLQYAYQTNIDPAIIEQAETAFSRGEVKLTLAVATFQKEAPALPASWGNVSLVNALALEALHSFHSMIGIIAPQWSDTSIIPDWWSLQDTLTRYEHYLEHITATLQLTQALQPNYDYTRVTNYVNMAEDHLIWAAANLTRLAVNQTTSNLNSARVILDKISQEVTQMTASIMIKGPQILDYINKSRQTLAAHQATALSLGLNIEQTVTSITTNLDTAQQFTEADAVDDAMPLLRETHQLLLELEEEIAREKVINDSVNNSQ
jgi:hypothetical protein